MSANTLLFTAVYDDVNDALADLDGVEDRHESGMVGAYNAAVIQKEDGAPRIARRMDHPGHRLIPEMVGAGGLPRKDLERLAEELPEGKAALIVLGEPTRDEWLEQAVMRAPATRRHSVEATAAAAADELMRRCGSAVPHALDLDVVRRPAAVAGARRRGVSQTVGVMVTGFLARSAGPPER